MSKVSHNKLGAFQLTQLVTDSEYWSFTDEEKKSIETAKNGNVEPLLRVLWARLAAAGLQVREMYGILHDKDSRESWSDTKKRNIIELKPPHVHIVVKFEGVGALLEDIARICGVEPQYIEKPQKGRYAYDNMLAYLTHVKYAEKHQYDPTEVLMLGVDGVQQYADIYKERYDTWFKGRAAVSKKAAEESIDWMEEQILLGKLTKSQIMLTDSYFNIYAHNRRRCEDAFNTYGERKAYKTMQALENSEFTLSVFFITGRSGAGKSRFASIFIDKLLDVSEQNGERWQVYKAAASNPLDDYRGEEVLFMDDLRGSAMIAEDWLKLLDPYNISPSSARYYNKTVAARTVVITSEKDPMEFFYYVKGGGNRSEALDQFIRRIQACVRVVSYGDDFDNAQYLISTSKKMQEHQQLIPNSRNRTTGYPEKVVMQYAFVNEQRLERDEAVQVLSDIVTDNNPSPEELLEKEQQRVTEQELEAKERAESEYIEEQLRLAGIAE